ncbi:hypothetical protein ACO0QE_003231 [Hanseniaspora vineae]
MSLKPQFFKSHVLTAVSAVQGTTQAVPPNLVELYLDYNCPFCFKIFKKWDDAKLFDKETLTKYNLAYRFNHVIQPWHPFGTLVHELGIVAGLLKPEAFWTYSMVLFRDSKELWSEEYTQKKTTIELYKELSEHCEKHTGLKADIVYDKLNGSGKEETIKAVKYFTRYHRQNGVHMTPTIAVNGIILGNIESSTDPEKVLEIIQNQTA